MTRLRTYAGVAGKLPLMAVLAGLGPRAQGGEEPVSFAREIAPILASKCVGCHGPEKSKGRYRLDTYERMLVPGDSDEAAVVPGSPETSRLLHLIVTADADDRMPQEDEALAPAQIELVRRWIAEGARVGEMERTLPVGLLAASGQQRSPPLAYPRPNPIHALTFSPDGGRLVVGGFHEVTLWDARGGTLQERWTHLVERTHDLVYAPDGAQLLVVGGSPGRLGQARLLNATNGTSLRVLALAPDSFLTGAFSPDGSRLAVGGCDRVIRILRTADGSVERTLPHHSDWVTDLAFSASGARLCSASRDGSARVFDVATGSMISAYRGHGQAVVAAAFGEDDSLVLSVAGQDLHAWKADTGNRTRAGQPAGATVLVLLRHKAALWLGSAHGRVVSCAMNEPGNVRQSLDGAEDAVYALALDPASNRLAAGGADGRVHIWNLQTGTSTLRFIASPGWENPPDAPAP